MTLYDLAPILERLSRVSAGHISFGPSAIDGWANGLLEGLRQAGIVTSAEFSPSTICPGCTRACVMEIKFIDVAGQSESCAYVVCDKIEDYGLIEFDHASLQQWRFSRAGVVEFVAKDLGLHAKNSDRALNRVQFGTSRQLRRTVSLEFGDTAQINIGNDRHALTDVLIWDGRRVRLNWELLHSVADQATETYSGGKRYQPSTAKRESGKRRTELHTAAPLQGD